MLVSSVIPLDHIQSRAGSDKWKWTALFACLTWEESPESSSHTLARSGLDSGYWFIHQEEKWHSLSWLVLIEAYFSKKEGSLAGTFTHVQQLFSVIKQCLKLPWVSLRDSDRTFYVLCICRYFFLFLKKFLQSVLTLRQFLLGSDKALLLWHLRPRSLFWFSLHQDSV